MMSDSAEWFLPLVDDECMLSAANASSSTSNDMTSEQMERNAVAEARRLAKEARKIAKYSTVKKRNVKNGQPRLKKQQKAALFLEWLVDTFDLKGQNSYACMKCGLLQAQSSSCSSTTTTTDTASNASCKLHVIDVAGGRGQLAFYLAAFYSIPTSVIDPAPMNLKRFEDMFAKKQAAVIRIIRDASAQANTPIDDSYCVVCKRAFPTPIVSSSSTDVSPSYLTSSSSSHSESSSASSVRVPVAWLPHLKHFPTMFPSSIALVTYKNHGLFWQHTYTYSDSHIQLGTQSYSLSFTIMYLCGSCFDVNRKT